MSETAVETVIAAARAWDVAGTDKILHVLTCRACERLEQREGRWCDVGIKLGRRQLDASRALHDAVARLDGDTR